jgi:hypothetical protein
MTDVTQDPSAGTPRRPWPADADWWSGDAETTGIEDPAKIDPAKPAAPRRDERSEAELADAWLRELGLNDAALTGAAPAPTSAPAPSGDPTAAASVSGAAKSVVPEPEASRPPANTGPEGTEPPTNAGLEVADPPANAGLEVADPPANAVGQMGTGPFELPPKVTRPAPPPGPPATAPTTAPARLLPAAPVTLTAILPSQPATPTDNLGGADRLDNVGGADQRSNVADAMVLPATVPTQRSYRPPPPTRPSARLPQRRRPPRPLWLSLPALVVLALATAFFAWVSAEPFWLAVGHGHTGTATIFSAPSGCRARFVADDGTFTVSTVEVAGLRGCPNGASPPAQMVSPRSARAYVTDLAGLNARWSIGFGLVVLCGLATATATGSGRLPGWRGTAAVGLSLAAPAVATLAMLAVAY